MESFKFFSDLHIICINKTTKNSLSRYDLTVFNKTCVRRISLVPTWVRKSLLFLYNKTIIRFKNGNPLHITINIFTVEYREDYTIS